MYRKKIRELICLYELEPGLTDIYVEGVSDKRLIDRYLKKYKAKYFRIYEVNLIDFSELYDEFPEIKGCNKCKALKLAEEFEECFDSSLDGVTVVVDKDFDQINGELVDNQYVSYYDYNSVELYLFNGNVLDIFIKNLNFIMNLSGNEILNKLELVLQNKFLFKLVLNRHYEWQFKSEQLPQLHKSLKFEKTTGNVVFCLDDYIVKTLHNFRKINEKDLFLQRIETYRKELDADPKNNIHGHDFVNILFLWFKAVKNQMTLKEDDFERFLFQSIDYSELRHEPFFVNLENKYKA